MIPDWTTRDRVHEFMQAVGQDVGDVPRVPNETVVRLRLRLITEEYFEALESALRLPDATRCLLQERILEAIETAPIGVMLPAFADALGDLDYVIEGARLAFGIDGGPILKAIHAANMKKLTGPVRKDGKRLKPAGWTPPDIAAELRAQGWNPDE